jgi:hypothetical protein
MDENTSPAGTSGLIDRVKGILLKPKDEWALIDGESTSIADIYKSYVIPLAAIGPVATLIHSLVFGYGAFGITYRPSFMSAISTAIISYLATLVIVYLLALLIDFLAPKFDATPNRDKAFKLAAYSATAGWVAAIFNLIPGLGMLTILGLYSVYLLYVGLPIMMKVPEDKSIVYTAITIVSAAVAGFVLSMLMAPLMLLFGGGAPAIEDEGALSGTVSIPGVGSLDVGKLEEASKQIEAIGEQVESGAATPPTAPAKLLELMPEALAGGLTRSGFETNAGSVGGIGGSTAEATYGEGENQITLEVTDLGGAAGLAALGGALNIESEKQDGTVSEKIGTVDGRMTTERYDSSNRRGTYSTIFASRFNVQAKGRVDSIDELKAAVAAVDLSELEGLAE